MFGALRAGARVLRPVRPAASRPGPPPGAPAPAPPPPAAPGR